MSKKSARCSEAVEAAALALVLCLAQIALLLALAPAGDSFSDRYLRLLNWDSQHYLSIATQGYVLPEGEVTPEDIHGGRANVVFFPGYPITARAISQITGISTPVSLLIVAQLSCWIFWTYFQLLLLSSGVSHRATHWALFFAALHPAAFFVVCGYTEPLFLASALGFLYWSEVWLKTKSRAAYLLSATHGFVMCATRIVGAALLPYPYLRGWRERAYSPALVLGIVGSLGIISFFVWCQAHFGDWAVYFKLEEIGWRNERMWFAVLDPRSYIPRFFFEHTVDSFNRASLPFTLFLFAWAWRLERKQVDRGARFPLYLCTFALFYIPLTGKANANMDSMIRYTFPVFVMMLLALVPVIQRTGLSTKMRWLTTAGALASLAIQLWFAARFLSGKWVA
jgi:hypothetical protein